MYPSSVVFHDEDEGSGKTWFALVFCTDFCIAPVATSTGWGRKVGEVERGGSVT